MSSVGLFQSTLILHYCFAQEGVCDSWRIQIFLMHSISVIRYMYAQL